MDLKYKTSDTGLYTEDVFKFLADYELSRVKRYPSPVSLLHVSLNLDKAKPAIAETLKKLFAGILNTSLRIADIPAHSNNDFLALMPSTDESGAQSVARRLITRLRGTRNFADGDTFKVVIHIGITTPPGGEGASAEKLLEQAEKALFEAKLTGPHTYKQFSED